MNGIDEPAGQIQGGNAVVRQLTGGGILTDAPSAGT